MISVRFTYETTSSESPEFGDFEDHGYCDCHGSKITYRSMSTEEINQAQAGVEQYTESGDLPYLIEDAIALGIYEPSASESCISEHTWFSSVDADINYATGEETRYSLHISGLDSEQMVAIAAILQKGRVTDEDEQWLNSLEQVTEEAK